LLNFFAGTFFNFEIINCTLETYRKVFFFEYPPLHDPLAIMYTIDPSLFETKLMRVDIETQSEMCR
jgi:inosine-uridine nucleoside N-ribohydrolase